jgi:hypothetical protein
MRVPEKLKKDIAYGFDGRVRLLERGLFLADTLLG